MGVPFDVIGISYDKFLVSVGVMDPSLYSAIFFNIIVFLLSFLFIYVLQWSYFFIAVAFTIGTIARTVFDICISYRIPDVERALSWPTWEVLTEWGQFLGLGLPGCAAMCAEWWAFEILTIFASVLGANAVDAQTIILQMSVLMFMFPYGVSMAVGSLVGNALGAEKIDLAMRISSLAIAFIFCVDLGLSMLIIKFGTFYIKLLTSDSTIIQTTSSILPFLAGFILVDGMQGVCGGIIQGAGKQKECALTAVLSYYGFGLPMAWYVAFRLDFGVTGLIIGISAGSCVQASILLYLIFCLRHYVFVPLRNCDSSHELIDVTDKFAV